MTDAEPEYATPTLMRMARGAYARAIRSRLAAIGIDDLPRNGAFILVGVDGTGQHGNDLPAALGVTKQAVSQVVDTLVHRGYLRRGPQPEDRRRVALALTDDGRRVIDAVVAAVDEVDEQLGRRVTADQVAAMRAGLAALADIKTATTAPGAGRARSVRQLRHFSPIFPVRELAVALDHYARLGFTTFAYADGADYGFANRDGIGIHLAADPDHDPGHGASTYLYVADADALFDEWTRPGIGGRTAPVGPTEYGLREGSHVDPDGNLIRFGSPVA